MKFVSLISSGIDSPVATYLFSKKAGELIFVHSDNRPFTDDREINNFIQIAKYLKKKMPPISKEWLLHQNRIGDSSYIQKSCATPGEC